jgi:hypothetical protein
MNIYLFYVFFYLTCLSVQMSVWSFGARERETADWGMLTNVGTLTGRATTEPQHGSLWTLGVRA